MRNKLSKIFALLLVSGIILCTAVACNQAGNADVPEGYTVNVTYYLTDGEFEDYSGKKYLDIYYKPDSKIAEPNVSSDSFKCKFIGHYLDGWFIAEKDADGKVITDEDGNPKASSNKFDFSQKVTEDMTLVAVWSRKIRLTFNNYYLTGGKNLYRSDCEGGGQIDKPTMTCRDSSNTVRNRDMLGYYWNYDEATDTYSNPIVFPLTYEYLDSLVPEDAEPDSETNYLMLYVYVKYDDTEYNKVDAE